MIREPEYTLSDADFAALLDARVNGMIENLHYADEQTAELEMEHASESAHYGDSWPGALLDIARAREATRMMRADLEAILALEKAFYGLA